MRALVFVALCMLAWLGGCDDADAHRARLSGTWQRDVVFEGGKGRATLFLERKGNFTERLQVSDSNGNLETIEYAGQWLTDGSSFTLRNLRENGRQYGGGVIRFTTLQLTSVTSEQFVGRNELRSQDVTFRRVDGPQL
jgi:hypothetical protein